MFVVGTSMRRGSGESGRVTKSEPAKSEPDNGRNEKRPGRTPIIFGSYLVSSVL